MKTLVLSVLSSIISIVLGILIVSKSEEIFNESSLAYLDILLATFGDVLILGGIFLISFSISKYKNRNDEKSQF